MGETDITSWAYKADTNSIDIQAVTGDVVITAISKPNTYSVTNSLIKATTSNLTSTVTHDSKYVAKLTPDAGYRIGSVNITMSGKDITSTVYSNGTITISPVTGPIVINAEAIEAAYTIEYKLTNVTSTNTTQAVKSGPYSTTLDAINNYTFKTLEVTMGGKTITPSSGGLEKA
jgi:hypothetical protein